MRAFMSLWEFYGFAPERYNLNTQSIPKESASYSYSLRPELAESLFYLDRVGGVIDSSKYTEWKQYGLQMLRSLDQLRQGKLADSAHLKLFEVRIFV